MNESTAIRRGARFVMGVAIVSFTVTVIVHGGDQKGSSEPGFRAQLGADSKKVRIEGEKTYLWAGGERSGPSAEWYDFTGSPIPTADLQYGIGKDRIRAVDDPLFVKPDDLRLAKLPTSHYRPTEKRGTNDDIMVIGYALNGEARAYPTALLDRHELVNDRIGGKPVTVGW